MTDSYDVVAGRWPEAYNEIVLVLDDKNSVPSTVLYQLGVLSDEEYKEIQDALEAGEEAPEPSWSYDDLMGKTFQLVPACNYYVDNGDGTFTDVHDDPSYQQELYDGGIPLTVSGIIRPQDGSENASIQTNLAYTPRADGLSHRSHRSERRCQSAGSQPRDERAHRRGIHSVRRCCESS